MTKKEFNIFGMTCGACQSHITRAVEKLDGVIFVNVNLLKNNMIVDFDENITNTNLIQDSVKNAGYEAQLIEDEVSQKSKNISDSNKKDFKNKIFSISISFIFLFLIMYCSMGNIMWNFYLPSCFDHINNPVGFAFIQFILLIPIVFINHIYFESGLKKLFKGKPNMDTLISIGAIFSIIYGIFSIFMIAFAQSQLLSDISLEKIECYKSVIATYPKNLYFESAGMILCFVNLGKFLEGLSKNQTKKAIEKLTELKPTTATILVNNEEKIVKIENVQINDIIIVKRGDFIPIDGEIINGQASINESSITGEPLPIQKGIGEKVYSSSVVENGYLQIRAKRVGEDTSFAKVVKLVEEASNSKAPISKIADKISGVFVPVILIISLVTFLVNLFVSKSFELSLNFAITVIVIACPCALGLATPVSIMVGAGKGAENGLLIKNAEIMEKAHLIKTVVFDKTGTITEGKPTVVKFEILKQVKDLLSIIYSIENKSEHPLAKAIINFTKQRNVKELDICDFKALDGFGLTAKINNNKYYIGNLELLKSLNIDYKNLQSIIDKRLNEAEIPLMVIENYEIVALIFIKDKIKETSKQAITLLKKSGIKTIMLTGDNKVTAEIIANEVGIDEFIAGVKPDEKLKIIKNLHRDKNHLVAMVGDGVNDAPALSSADLGISVGSGTEIALESSDIVLLRNDLLDVLNVIKLSKKVLKTIKLGLFWAFFYNFICVFISTGIFYYPFGFKINPMIGSIAMSFSSISVVLNALTINFFKPLSKTKDLESNNNCKLDKCEKSNKEIDNFDRNINNGIVEKEGVKVMEFYVKEMMCRNCENHIRKAFEKAGIYVLEINLETKKVYLGSDISFEEVVEIVKDAGYEATLD